MYDKHTKKSAKKCDFADTNSFFSSKKKELQHGAPFLFLTISWRGDFGKVRAEEESGPFSLTVRIEEMDVVPAIVCPSQTVACSITVRIASKRFTRMATVVVHRKHPDVHSAGSGIMRASEIYGKHAIHINLPYIFRQIRIDEISVITVGTLSIFKRFSSRACHLQIRRQKRVLNHRKAVRANRGSRFGTEISTSIMIRSEVGMPIGIIMEITLLKNHVATTGTPALGTIVSVARAYVFLGEILKVGVFYREIAKNDIESQNLQGPGFNAILDIKPRATQKTTLQFFLFIMA